MLARFHREARATARLRSEHIARVRDYGEITSGSGEPPARYLVMDLLAGIDLRAEVRERGGLSVRRASEYVSQACLGLAEAHALGIVHRDIKPANLFVTRTRDGRSLIKLLDFGIA